MPELSLLGWIFASGIIASIFAVLITILAPTLQMKILDTVGEVIAIAAVFVICVAFVLSVMAG